jgi:hypothetical protein
MKVGSWQGPMIAPTCHRLEVDGETYYSRKYHRRGGPAGARGRQSKAWP